MTCLDIGEFEELTANEVDPGRAAKLRDHISGCPACSKREREISQNLHTSGSIESYEKSAAVAWVWSTKRRIRPSIVASLSSFSAPTVHGSTRIEFLVSARKPSCSPL
jgi:hypothetical protein